jgi:HAD superfamily hydrolase (TIGR01509 family)
MQRDDRTIQAVLFDLDGTLIDSVDHIVDCWQYTVRTVLGREITREEVLPTIGRHLLTCFEEIAPGRSEELYDVYREYEAAAHDSRIKLVPGTRDVLVGLKRRRVPLGLVTSKGLEIATRGLELFKLSKYFDTLVTREDTERHKPHPDPLLVGAQRLGVAPERTVYVGDSSVDVLAGKAAGMLTAWAAWGADKPRVVDGERPDYVLYDISEVVALVRGLRGQRAAGLRARALGTKRGGAAGAHAAAAGPVAVGQPVYPFRWDVTKRSQLGSLIDIPEAERIELFESAMYSAASGKDWSSVDHSIPLAQWFERELSLCCARSLAFCDDADLYFVGRSPQSLFDYLSGLLFDSSWANRLTLLHFSARWYSVEDILRDYSTQLEELYAYLEHIELSPRAIAQRSRPTTFIDIVARGSTFGMLVSLLHLWAKGSYPDWSAVRRKIRIVGLTARTKTSPKTWRWQEHVDWVELLEPGSIKNVSIPSALFHYLGGAQPKTSHSYPPYHWGDPEVQKPLGDDWRARHALAQAVSLFDKGRDRETRRAFVAQMAEQPAMQYPWYRSLANEIAGR